MALSVYWIGLRELTIRVERSIVALNAAVGSGLYQEASAVLGKTLAITPIDTGNLRASGHVTTPTYAAGIAEVTVGFGGAAAPYAIFVHERLDLHHEPPTQAKFLEKTVLEEASGFAERLAAQVEFAI